MTVPNSNCVRIVTPDEHVGTGFQEILVYDMGQEEWPQVPLSEIGCLRLDWPKDLFAFMGRYQLELEQMRKACRDRFGPAASGTCPTCDKFIQVNLGKHAISPRSGTVMALPSGVGKIVESLTIVLGGQIGSGKCHGGSRQKPTEGRGIHDVGSPDSGTIRNVVTSDVGGNVEHWCGSYVVFPVDEVDKLSVMPRAQRAAKYMSAMGLRRPPSGPGVTGPLPKSTCPSCMNCEYCFGRKDPSPQ